ncbi:helix-turn-helix transcriptional regulator [Paenibacillus massiliensis]|uniref:helix-turn-helix transcriptional regulator n=1 Tax=Paenibacillus massiliensis TaxID=225917 RepID=UPI0004B3DA4A|nr:helix-turn-helix transcriptional regulator [Paenibacillus massiliensis]
MPPPPYISLLQQELEERYTERITLEELARAYSRSKFVLSREFKRYIGISLQEYIILHRITAAKNLLKHTELTVTEIAAQVGIDNPSHFINLFKAREELTPLAYRKRWNEY